ncbi:MAG: hypothetical protein HKO95_14755, partial [Rhodobacteraceae bacterium]|nr:hypothetical protein [Paracoccaceae bacterium]
MFNITKVFAATAAAATLAIMGSAASAATLTFYDDVLDADRVTIDCASCSGYSDEGWVNATGTADLYPNAGGIQDEVDFVNGALGENLFMVEDASKTELTPGANNYTIEASAASYILIKIGSGGGESIGLIRNDSGAAQDYVFTNLCSANEQCSGGG